MFPVAASRLPVNLRRLGWVALACSAAGLTLGLSACGGGSRNSFYAPNGIVSFGDENSAIEADTLASLKDSSGNPTTLPGLTYTVHTVDVVGPATCTSDGTPKICGTDSGTFGTLVSTNYYVLNPSIQAVTKLELDNSATTLQRTTTTFYNCATPSIWVQVVARAYGRGYNTACPSEAYGNAVSYAVYGAKSDDVVAQIADHRGELGGGVLATIMAGQNDVLEQYALVQATPSYEAAAIAELQARADRMAAAIKDAIGTGAKVMLALTPSLNESPKAFSGSDNADLLSRLTVAYNDRLYVRGLGNVSGRDLVGVNPDTFTNTSTRSTSYVYRTPLCNTAAVTLPDGTSPVPAGKEVKYCNTNTLVSSGSTSTYMWADNTHFAPLGHGLIGSLGFNRAHQQF